MPSCVQLMYFGGSRVLNSYYYNTHKQALAKCRRERVNKDKNMIETPWVNCNTL